MQPQYHQHQHQPPCQPRVEIVDNTATGTSVFATGLARVSVLNGITFLVRLGGSHQGSWSIEHNSTVIFDASIAAASSSDQLELSSVDRSLYKHEWECDHGYHDDRSDGQPLSCLSQDWIWLVPVCT